MNSIVSLGVDLGRSGKTAFSVLAGDETWHTRVLHMEDISSISAPEAERILNVLNSQYQPNIIIIEANGPGGVLAEFAVKNNPNLPLYAVFPDHPALDIYLWNDIVMTEREFLNLRAQNYFIIRYLFRDNRIVLPYEDPELFAQLTSTYWEADRIHSDKIKLTAKKQLRFSSHGSELEGYDFSRSPDKADALALAALGYAMLMQDEHAGSSGEAQEEEIIEPFSDGFFPIGATDIEIELE